MPLIYRRTVRLSDTDAAGVIYFANVLEICHEAYEESLAVVGINLRKFVSNSSTAIPLVHASVDFFAPIFCGDQLLIQLKPQPLNETEFEIAYQVSANSSAEKILAKAMTRHVCINPTARVRTKLPALVTQWLGEMEN
ncbi:MAG: thioesterase family protein [Coleofasciculaceae cyanobacterium]